MLDTHIYDLIIADPGLADHINHLTDSDKVVILCTHVQDDELSKIVDIDKREKVFNIKRHIVSTAGAIYGISRYGMATYGDGSQSGISLDQIRSPEKRHSKDALIATTAARDADVLVTEDRRLINRFKAASSTCEVWQFEQFKQYLSNL